MRIIHLLVLLLSLPTALYAEKNAFHDVADEFLAFVDHKAGIITPQQLHEVGLENVVLINLNVESQYNKGQTLAGSINMDWREVLKRRNEIPHDKTVVMYCNTMLYSSRAQLLVNMDGFDNVLLLQGGLNNWNNYQASLDHTDK